MKTAVLPITCAGVKLTIAVHTNHQLCRTAVGGERTLEFLCVQRIREALCAKSVKTIANAPSRVMRRTMVPSPD
jgi:hypothetical protein